MFRLGLVTILTAVVSTGFATDRPDNREETEDGCSRAKIALHRIETLTKHLEDSGHALTDVQHYVLDFEVDPAAEIIDGSTTMTVMSRVDDLSEFRFWLNETMVISSVEIDGQAASWQRFDTTRVDVNLDRVYAEGEIFALEVSYRGRPAPAWFFSTQGTSPIVSTLSQPWNASDWWAVKNDNTDKATGELLVTVPANLIVVSNGVWISTENVSGNRSRFHWSTAYPTTPYLFAFSTTEYNTFEETYFFEGGSMPVEFFIYPDSDTTENRDGWRLSVDMLATFEELFGPYPFQDEKYAIYQFPFGGGMEHQTASGQGGNSAFRDYLTAHEAAHQWWGDMVTCATWNDIWLNEGFATYSTGLWYEWESGTSNPDALQTYMEIRRPDQLDGTVYVYDASDSARIFSSNYSYSKGAWVVHMLRGVVGDENFFDILAAYRDRYEFSTATTDDFKRVAEEIWGSNLAWFFDEWVYGGGAPAYRNGWQETVVNGQRYLELLIEQSQNEAVFQMPLEIVTDESGQPRSYTIWNDARVEHHLIPVSGAVDDVDLDPENWILSRINIEGRILRWTTKSRGDRSCTRVRPLHGRAPGGRHHLPSRCRDRR